MTAVTIVHPCHHDRRAGRHLAVPPTRARAKVHARRRVVALLVLVAACLALRWAVGGLGGAPLAASEPTPAAVGPRAGHVHVVQPGDTLWEVARVLQPEGDVRPLVDRLASDRGGRPLLVGEWVRAP